jgi:glycine/D-amino acid oxidase-like deaminating enzyme
MEGDDALLYERESGYFEPTESLQDLSDSCRRDGVDMRLSAEVTRIMQSDKRVTGVQCADGSVVHTECVVNAAGPWVNNVLGLAKLKLPKTFTPVRIQVIYKQCPELFTDDACLVPGICDTVSGFYCRPQIGSKQMIVSTVKEEEERDAVPDPDHYSRVADPEYRQRFLNSFHHRFPESPARGNISSMSGLYTICEDDVHPCIGDTELGGFVVCNGFSGHGFKCAPAVGSLVAQHVSGVKRAFDDDTAVDIDFFSPYREPLVLESKNVLA